MRKGKWVALVLLGVMLLATACSSPSQSTGSSTGAANNTPIKIGLLIPLTGVFAAPGKYMQEGVQLALQQSDNKLAGRPVDLVIADSQGNPQAALTQARKLVEQDKVDAIIGPLSAAEGNALVQYIDGQQVPTIYPIVSSDDLTQRTIPKFIVRTGWTSSQTTMPFGEYSFKTLGYKKVATVSYDFSFGWESIGGFVQTFQDAGGKVTKQLWPPLNETNFQPYLSQIPKDVDAVFVSFSGSAAIAFVQQYKQFGLNKPLIAQGNTVDESTLQQTGPSAVGILSTLHYSAALDNPDNKAFVAAYEKAYTHGPSYYSEGAYVGTLVLKQALEARKGDTKDKAALVAAMKAVSLNSAPRGPVKMDQYGNPIENVYIRKVESVNGKLQNTVIYTYPAISQFWNYDPKAFLGHPVFSRSFPVAK
ncbi:MAG: ABC transporter substrate-binding protein [Symbiobacteriia bacterium]